MAEPRHRKPQRRKGLAVRSGGGRRRRSGAIDDVPRSARELHRRARRSEASQARRRIGMALMGAMVIIGTSVLFTWLTLREEPDTGVATDLPSATGSSVLVALTDENGRSDSLVLIVAHPEHGSEVVLFPPSLLTVLPGFGESEIADAVRFNGPPLARTTVGNLLGIRIDTIVHLDGEAFSEAVGRSLTVDLNNPLLAAGTDTLTVLAAEGSAERDIGMLVTLLTEQGDGDQLEWLDRQGSVWRAVLRAISEEPVIADRIAAAATGSANTAQEVLLAVAGDAEVVVTSVPVRRIEATGGGTERYQLPSSSASSFVADRFPFLILREEPRPRVEVLNGNGRIGTTGPIAAMLVDRGYRIIKTDNADRNDYLETRVIAQGREHQQDALDVRELLGVGEVLLEMRQPSGVVDLTIIVGRDLPA